MNQKWNFGAMNIFGMVMVVLYFAAGLYILLTNAFAYLPAGIKEVFGAFLILYGVFRGVRLYFSIKNPQQ